MDLDKFVAASLSPRTATIPVPELKAFFGGRDNAEWTVRGLTGTEMGRIKQAISKEGQEKLQALIEALAGAGDKAEALKAVMGTSGADTPEDVSRRIEMLAAGSVEPSLGPEKRDVAVKLAEAFPTIFYNLTQHILTLTGQGHEVGKPKRSGKTVK
jgi:hypothetical protein